MAFSKTSNWLINVVTNYINGSLAKCGESFEEDEVAFSWYWADVQINKPVDNVKRAKQ